MAMNAAFFNALRTAGKSAITHIGLVDETGTELTGGSPAYARQAVTWADGADGVMSARTIPRERTISTRAAAVSPAASSFSAFVACVSAPLPNATHRTSSTRMESSCAGVWADTGSAMVSAISAHRTARITTLPRS